MSEDDKKILKDMAGFDDSLSPEDEQYAFNAGNSRSIFNALNEVVKMAEVGLMVQKKKIKDKKDRDMYMKRQATCIFLLKMLNEGIKEQIPEDQLAEMKDDSTPNKE